MEKCGGDDGSIGEITGMTTKGGTREPVNTSWSPLGGEKK
jgi:hypothetical protein